MEFRRCLLAARETLTPTDHVHLLRIAEPDQLDDQVLGWMRQAYEVGEQKHLA